MIYHNMPLLRATSGRLEIYPQIHDQHPGIHTQPLSHTTCTHQQVVVVLILDRSFRGDFGPNTFHPNELILVTDQALNMSYQYEDNGHQRSLDSLLNNKIIELLQTNVTSSLQDSFWKECNVFEANVSFSNISFFDSFKFSFPMTLDVCVLGFAVQSLWRAYSSFVIATNDGNLHILLPA